MTSGEAEREVLVRALTAALLRLAVVEVGEMRCGCGRDTAGILPGFSGNADGRW